MIVPIFANQKIRISYKTTENIALQLRGQVRLPSGEVVDIVDSKNVTGVTSGTVTSGTFEKTVPLGELITLTAKTSTASIQRGQSYLRADLIYAADSFEAAGLFAKYVTSDSPVNLGQFEDSLSGEGYSTSYVITNPGAGAEINGTLPTGIVAEIDSFKFNFTASAVVANRKTEVSFFDGSNLKGSLISGITVTASQIVHMNFTRNYPFSRSITDASTEITTADSLPGPMKLSSGLIQSLTEGLDTNDDAYTSILVSYRQWIKA